MLFKHSAGSVIRTILFGIVTVALLTTEVQARGGGAGNYLTSPGQCTGNPDTTAASILTKIDNQWHFAIQVVGPNSVGAWNIKWAKNNILVHTSSESYPPPGGWASFGLATNPPDKGLVTFAAEATNLNTGTICTAMVSIKA